MPDFDEIVGLVIVRIVGNENYAAYKTARCGATRHNCWLPSSSATQPHRDRIEPAPPVEPATG